MSTDHLLFVPPIPLQQTHLTIRSLPSPFHPTSPISTRLPPRHPTSRRATPHAQWQQSLVPPDPLHIPLSTLYASFPKQYLQAFPLGINASQTIAYITSHHKLSERRPAAPRSNRAMPIPFPKPTHTSANLLRDAMALAHTTPPRKTPPFTPHNAASVLDALPTSLCNHLAINHITANTLAAEIFTHHKSNISLLRNRALWFNAILQACDARIVATAIMDAPSTSLTGDNVTLRGALYVEKCVARLYGEVVYGDAVPISVDATFALAVAVTMAYTEGDCPCFISTDIFHSASVPIRDMSAVYASRGNRCVQSVENEDDDEKAIEKSSSSSSSPEHENLPAGKVWQWTATEVLSLSNTSLTTALRQQGTPTHSNESRPTLLAKLAEYMDEVHRRELGIALAAQNEQYALAAELQRGRSRRGQLLADLREAEENGEWETVARLAAEMKRVEMRTHDVTLEPGSYDPYLDQDDWYKPCR